MIARIGLSNPAYGEEFPILRTIQSVINISVRNHTTAKSFRRLLQQYYRANNNILVIYTVLSLNTKSQKTPKLRSQFAKLYDVVICLQIRGDSS